MDDPTRTRRPHATQDRRAGRPRGFPWRRLRRRAACESGAATLEFVILFPVYMLLFVATFELGSHMVKQLMLDRALDVTVRAVRLGTISDPSQELLRKNICDNVHVIPNCQLRVTIEMTPVAPGEAVALTTSPTCVERNADGELEPVTGLLLKDGQPNEMMLVRVCAEVDPLMPASGLGVLLKENGGYHVVTTSAFVIEPQS